MPYLFFFLAFLLIILVLWDAFETIILPRRVVRRFRLTRFFYQITWMPVAMISRRIRNTTRREGVLGIYGPLALIALLTLWVTMLIIGFALSQWSLGSPLTAPEGRPSFETDLYLSGTTFFTLGLGDVTPDPGWSRLITVLEAGTGFAILAMVIGYLPVLYQAFSRREVSISLLDARAGSPPSALTFLERQAQQDGNVLDLFLREWERWSAELLESHLSYPPLAYFRSQHENQSWLAAITMVLDTCALVMVGIDGVSPQTARLTFAMARHAAVDLCQVFNATPDFTDSSRLDSATHRRICAALGAAGTPLKSSDEAEQQLAIYRHLYEPYVVALSERLLLPLPRWVPETEEKDDWERTSWEGLMNPL